MPEFTPDATFMSRSELDEFLAIRSTFSPETQSYLDKADRQIPKTFLDRNALAERAQTGFADDIEAEGFSRTWVQDFFDMDPSGMDFDTLSEYVTGEKMAPQDFTTRIGELMSRTAAGGPEPVDTLKDLTPEQREALSDDDVRDLLAKSPKAALQSYEQMMTPQEEFAARRIALQNDPDKAIELLSKFGFEQQNNILAWARVARPELDEDDSLFETIERKLGFTFTENVPRQIRREFDSLAEVLDFDHNRMLHAYSNGNAIIRTMGDGLPFDDRGQWKSNAQRIEFRNRMAERLYQQRRDEIVNPSGTIASEDLRNAIWGAPALDEAAIRDEANKKAAEITERFAPLYEAQSSEIKRLIGVKNAYQTLAPKVKKEGNAVNYYGSAAVEVIADIGIFMALSAPTAGAGGYAYGYTRVQSDLELELMEGGVDPLAAKRISMTFAVPHAMVEKYAAVLFRPVKGSVSKIAAKGLEKSGLTKGTGLLGKFARRVAPDRVAEIQTGVLTSLTQSWPGIFAQNMKKVAIQRGIASLGEFGQEALQDAIEASSKSFAIEFADAHGLDHGKVWQEWQDGLGELFITMALVGAAPGVIDVPAAAIGSTAGFRNGELMELAEQGRDLPPAQLDERVTVESLAAYNSAGTAEGRRAILAAAGHEDLDAADRLYAKEAELHADKLADLQTVEREANAEAQRETEETDQLGARVPAEHQPAPTVAPAAPATAAPAAAPTRAPLKHDVGVLRKLAAALNPEGDLLVFDSMDDVLESDLFTDQDKAEIAQAQAAGKVEGFRATLADGRNVTVLPLDGAPDQTAAVKKLYHEVFHDAVRRLGKAVFAGNSVFGNWNDVYALVGEARIRRVVPQFYFDKYETALDRDAKLAEEYTARVLERMETKAGGIGLKDNTLFQKIRSAARQYLGIKTADEMTNEALAALMRQAIRLNQDPKIAKQAEARQIQIKRELEKSRGERPDFSVEPVMQAAFNAQNLLDRANRFMEHVDAVGVDLDTTQVREAIAAAEAETDPQAKVRLADTAQELARQAMFDADELEDALLESGDRTADEVVQRLDDRVNAQDAGQLGGREVDFSVEQDRLAELNPHLTVTDAGTPFATRNDAARVGTALSTAKGKNAVEHTNSSNISRDMVPLDVLAKQMAQIKRSTPGYGALPDAFFNETDPVKKADILVEWRKKNLIALHNAFPEDLRERATHWYDGANRIAHYLADTYGMTVSQAGAVLAALSPQKHWFHNVAQAEQVIDIWNHERTTVLGGEEFQAVFDQIADAATPTKNQLDSKTTQLAKTRLKNKVKRDRRKVMEQMNGKTVEQLYNEYVESGSASAKALLGFATRTIAQTRYGQTVSIIEPEGDPRGQMRNKPSKKNPTGAAASHTWGGGDEIAKAISVMLDGSAANISANLGEAHKVRSFYNNIVSPWSEHEDITGDTHAVAAEDLLPYGASAIPVKHNLGTGASSNSGVSGMYHITADAYRAAAKELGLLPRQLQSIVWEAIRGMYTAADKNKDFTKDREDVWKNNDEETARAILAGQTILRPSWADGADGSGEFTGGQAGDAGTAGQEAQSGRNLRFDGRRSSRLLDVGIPEIGSAEFEASKTGLTVQQAAGLDIGVAPEAEEQDLAARLQNLGLDFSIAPAHDTAEWKEWFGDSKVVDSDGDPLVVKHGTTHAFDAFDKSKANVNNDFGQGFYFTNDSGDASENYAGIGPDLTNRLETLEEQLIQQYEDDPEGFAEAEGFDPELEDRELEAAITAAAERRLVGDDVRTIEAYLSFQNPYVLGGDARQFIELEYETIEEDGEQVTDFDSEPTGPLWDFVEALEQELLDSDFADADAAAELRNEILERANYEAITLLGLDLIIRESPAFQEFTNDEGTMAGNEAYRAAIEAAGFDGIIDHTVSTKFRNMGLAQGTTHYIAFKSEQVKAVDNARPTADPRLDFSVETFPPRVAYSTQSQWLRKHPDHDAAKKKGDLDAAARLVARFWKPKILEEVLANLDTTRPIVVVPVAGVEGEALNVIPVALAVRLAEELGAEVYTEVVKADNGKNTDAPADERSRTEHVWEGQPPPEGVQVVVVDDVFTTGQTVGSMIGHLGRADALATLAISQYGSAFGDTTALPRLLEKANITKEYYDEAYDNGLTGAQISSYLKHGAKGKAGLIRRFDPATIKSRRSVPAGQSQELDFSVAQQQDPGREASVRLAYVILSRKSVKIDKPSAMKYLDEHFPDLKNKDQVLAKSRAIARSLETRRPELISNVEQAYLAIRKMEIAEASRQKIDAEHGKLFVSGAVSEQQQQARQRSSDRKLASRLGMSPQEIKDNDLEIANLVKDLEEQERLQKIKPASEADETTEKGDDLEAIERSKAITAELLIEPTDKREAVQKFIDRVRAAIVGQDSTEREKVVDFRRTLQRLLYSAINQLNHGKAREDLMRHTRELDQFVRLDSLANQATNILSHAYQARLRQGRRTLEQDIGSILRKWASGQIPSRMRQDKRKLPAEFQQYLKAALIAFNMTGQEYELAMGALLDGSAYDKVPSDIDTTEFTQQQILQADALVRFGGLKFRGLADHVAAHQFLTSEIEQRLKAHQEAVELKKEQDRARRSWIMNILPDRGGQHPGSGFAKWVASTRDSLTKTLAMEERFEWMLQGSKDKPAGTLLRTFARRIFRQADKARLETIRHQEAFLESAKVIYGRDAESIVEDLLRPQDRYAEFSSSGLAALSKSQVMQQVATLQQQQYYESFLGSDDAVRRARAEKLPAMLDSLSDQDLEMLDWFREFYADQRDELSAVNLRVTGLPVLSPDELYMPVKMRAKGGLGETHIVVPIVPPSLTPRIPSTLDLDESAGVVDMFQNRAQSNAQYKHLAELHVEIRGVFADGKLQTAMEDALGKTFTTDTLNHFGDIFAGQGPIGNHYPGLTKLVSWFAIMKLGTNLRMLPRQATSFVAYAGSRVHTVNTSSETGVHGSMDGYKITVLDTFKWATAGVLTPEGWKAVKQIWKSEQFQARKRSGNTQILADVTANLDNPKWMRKFVRRGMYFNALGDFAGLAFSGQGIMRMIKADLMATGMSEAEAAAESMNQFWQIAELNQQSSAVTNQSVWQRQLGAPGKILGQFTSTPQQFLAKEVIQGMEILNGSGGNKALAAAKFLTSRKVLVNHVLLPGFYHGVNILIDSMQGDDFDDDEIELLIASMLIGPLSGWFIFGNVVAGMVDIFTTAALGTKPNRGQGGDLVPVSGITSDLAIPMAHVIYGLGSMLRGEEMEVEFEDALLHSLEGFIPLVREIRKFTDDE